MAASRSSISGMYGGLLRTAENEYTQDISGRMKHQSCANPPRPFKGTFTTCESKPLQHWMTGKKISDPKHESSARANAKAEDLDRFQDAARGLEGRGTVVDGKGPHIDGEPAKCSPAGGKLMAAMKPKKNKKKKKSKSNDEDSD